MRNANAVRKPETGRAGAEQPAGPAPPDGEPTRWYRPVAVAADALGVLLPVLTAFPLTGQPAPAAVAVTAAGAWLAIRAAHGRYTRRCLGESRGLLTSLHDWVLLLGALALLRVLTGEGSAVPVALAALAPALLVTAVTGALLHAHLAAERRQAHAVHRVLLVGESGPAEAVAAQLAARTDHGYVVVGAVPVGEGPATGDVPVCGRLPTEPPHDARVAGGEHLGGDGGTVACAAADGTAGGGTCDGHAGATRSGSHDRGARGDDRGARGDGGTCDGAPDADGARVLRAARRRGADRVLVVPGARLTGERLRRLGWAVHDAGVPLAVASGLSDVAPHRLTATAPAGLHVLRVAPPVRSGGALAVKAVLDRVTAAAGLVLVAPLLAVLALAVRLDSPGPALYRQRRVGQHGVPFTLWKFRTMVVDADRLRHRLESANDQRGGPLFKMRRDPRVTRVGRFLRRTSLDELPQLWNVLRGRMSLVGPRPPLPEEVARYSPAEHRRLLVRPGMTGPWQVSGRSDLSWDEGVALDLSYADNWSLTRDLDLLARTVRAVVGGRGAY